MAGLTARKLREARQKQAPLTPSQNSSEAITAPKQARKTTTKRGAKKAKEE